MNASIAEQFARTCTAAYKGGSIGSELADAYDFGGGLQVGVVFQLAVTVAALRRCQTAGISVARRLCRAAEKELRAAALARPFSYFGGALPPDFDTAAAVVSVRPTRKLSRAFTTAVRRHARADGLVPTWFDVTSPSKFPVDSATAHVEVQLVVQLALLELGHIVTADGLTASIEACGLEPFWYYPTVYPAFLAALLVRRANLSLSGQQLRTVRDRCARTRPRAAGHPLPAVSGARDGYGDINHVLAALTERLLSRGPVAAAFPQRHNHVIENDAVYWTVGFRPFVNRLFTLAFLTNAILSVVEVEAGK